MCMRITVNGCMVDISIKRSCPVNLWNQAKENSKGKDRMSVELNHYLEITRSHVHQIYRELETSGKVITVDLVRKLFYGVDEDSKTLLQVFREHNEQIRKLIGKDFVIFLIELSCRVIRNISYCKSISLTATACRYICHRNTHNKKHT